MYYNVLRYIHWKWGPLRFTVCRQALSVQDPINHVNKIESVKVVWIFLILCEFSRWGNTWVVRVSQIIIKFNTFRSNTYCKALWVMSYQTMLWFQGVGLFKNTIWMLSIFIKNACVKDWGPVHESSFTGLFNFRCLSVTNEWGLGPETTPESLKMTQVHKKWGKRVSVIRLLLLFFFMYF